MSYAESCDIGSPIQASHWYTQSVVATGGVYKGQGQSRDELCDPPLLGIPSWWRIIAITSPNYAHVLAHSECKHMHKCFIGLPTPFDAGLLPLNEQRHRASPIDTSSVTRVQPRASKGMTDLLLPPVSYDLCISVVNPSKKIHLRGAPHRANQRNTQRWSTKDHWIYVHGERARDHSVYHMRVVSSLCSLAGESLVRYRN